MFKNKKYLKKLKKETDDFEFINKVNEIKNRLLSFTFHDKNMEQKINKHYKQLQINFLNINNNNITYLEEKKMAFDYHLYLLNTYYNYLYENLFT